MRRGEVWWVDFDAQSVGGEIRKARPAIIVSNNAANAALNRVQVIPLTSNSGRVYPSEAVVRIGDRTSKAMADQIATVSKARLRERLGVLNVEDLMKVERATIVQLGLV